MYNYKSFLIALSALQEEESGGSSTDMSICRSEALFSSMRDSATNAHMQQFLTSRTSGIGAAGAGVLVAGGGADGAGGAESGNNAGSLLQDSLIDLNLSEQVKVNKNHYTLTFSGQPDGSLIASLVSSARGAALKCGKLSTYFVVNFTEDDLLKPKVFSLF